MRTIGQSASTRKPTTNRRFVVTCTLKGKVLHKSVGMLFKDEAEAEGWVIRTLTNCGVKLEEGTQVVASATDKR